MDKLRFLNSTKVSEFVFSLKRMVQSTRVSEPVGTSTLLTVWLKRKALLY